MKKLFVTILLTLLIAPASLAQGAVTVFKNVNVIPMDTERVLKNQTVIIRDGLIAEIGPKAKAPKGATVIDGKGKFLIPGLSDMHVHLMSDDGFPREYAEDELKVMIANGVTTARFMIGIPEHLEMRSKAAAGQIISPLLYVASPQFIGKKITHAYVVTTPEEGREGARKAKADGYDYLKMTTALKPEVYEAIVDEAKKLNIKVVGHADSRSIGLERALKAGQQIEHLDSYLEALIKPDAPMKGSVSDIYLYNPKNWDSFDHMDESKIPVLAQATVKANPFSDPTLSLFKATFGTFRTEESIRAQPDFRFYPAKTKEMWLKNNERILKAAVSAEKRAKYADIRNRLTKAIYDAGGKILAGSDTPEFLFLYGFSLHRELRALRDAGLSNYAALEAATRNPALFFGTENRTGSIARGYRADLVLLDADPLADIANTEKRSGVMIGGRWFTQAEMNKWLDEIAPKFSAVEMKE